MLNWKLPKPGTVQLLLRYNNAYWLIKRQIIFCIAHVVHPLSCFETINKMLSEHYNSKSMHMEPLFRPHAIKKINIVLSYWNSLSLFDGYVNKNRN